MKIDNNSNNQAAMAEFNNAKLNKFGSILFYWSIFHTCAQTSTNKSMTSTCTPCNGNCSRAPRVCERLRAINVSSTQHTSRRASFESFMTFLRKKLESSCKIDLSSAIVYYTLIVYIRLVYVQLPSWANFDLSTMNKKKVFARKMFGFQITRAPLQ